MLHSSPLGGRSVSPSLCPDCVTESLAKIEKCKQLSKANAATAIYLSNDSVVFYHVASFFVICEHKNNGSRSDDHLALKLAERDRWKYESV